MFIFTEKMSSILYLKDKIMSEKRVCVQLAEKKSYAEMIVKGASRSTVSEIYRKKHGWDPGAYISTVKNWFEIDFRGKIQA